MLNPIYPLNNIYKQVNHHLLCNLVPVSFDQGHVIYVVTCVNAVYIQQNKRPAEKKTNTLHSNI